MLDNHGDSLTMCLVLDILDKLYCTFIQRADLLPGPERTLYCLSIDFSLCLSMYDATEMLKVMKFCKVTIFFSCVQNGFLYTRSPREIN